MSTGALDRGSLEAVEFYAEVCARARSLMVCAPFLLHEKIRAALVKDLYAKLGVTFVVVEHKIRALSAISQRMLILNFGSVLILDTPERVLKDDNVIRIYLGKRNLA